MHAGYIIVLTIAIIIYMQSNWIKLLKDPKESTMTFYWRKMTSSSCRSKVKDIIHNPWPLSVTLPDLVLLLIRYYT